MDIFGIKNITDEQLKFDYDKFYRKVGLMLKKIETEEEKKQVKETIKKELNIMLASIEIDINVLKDNFIKLILDEKSSKLLWILYSKYKDEENYIDKISDILKQTNEVTRGGINTYKINGWMAHSLYVYQIVNYNIANNIEIANFNGNKENKEQINELHGIYQKLSKTSKFVLKIFTLIHDIGVIDDVKFHDKLGVKYVNKVLQEIGVNQDMLDKENISIDEQNLLKTLQQIIKYHTLITSLSSESSDLYVKGEYDKLLSGLIEVKEIPKILMLFAYGDVIAVDESIMDMNKYENIRQCYEFFEQISNGQKIIRDKEKVAIERISDIVGENEIQNLVAKLTATLEKYNINKTQFIEDMYNIKLMRFTSPLMKTLKNTEMSIRIFYELFELIGKLNSKEELKDYTIIFVPDRSESDFVKQINNNNLFECIREMKNTMQDECTFKNINILKKDDSEGKCLYIRVV